MTATTKKEKFENLQFKPLYNDGFPPRVFRVQAHTRISNRKKNVEIGPNANSPLILFQLSFTQLIFTAPFPYFKMKHLRGQWFNSFLYQWCPWGCQQIIKTVLQILAVRAIGSESNNHFLRSYLAQLYARLFSPASIISWVQKLYKKRSVKTPQSLKLITMRQQTVWNDLLDTWYFLGGGTCPQNWR